ncbi:MAG: hypothetical protein CMF48_05645 [Legionellales bacterium]|nr:hypothetical protein [Legionellales bacterium]
MKTSKKLREDSLQSPHWILFPYYFVLQLLKDIYALFTFVFSPIKKLIDNTWSTFVAKTVVPARQARMKWRYSIGGISKKDRKPYEFGRLAVHASVDRYFHSMAELHGMTQNDYDINHFYITSDDGKSRLDTMQIKPEGWDDLPPEERSVTIMLHGNTTRFEFDHAQGRVFQFTLDRYREAQDKKRLVITCNYEDVGFSHRTDGKTKSLKTTLDSLMSVVEYAIHTLKVPPSNVLGVGHSFGGLAMQYLLAKSHKSGYPIRGCIDRTGPSVCDIIVGFVWNAFDKIGLGWLGKIVSEICRPFIWVLLKLANHQISLGNMLLGVDPKYYYISTLRADAADRAHHFLHDDNLTTMEATPFKCDDDRVIVHKASLWRFMRDKIPSGCRYSRIELKRRMETIIDRLYERDRPEDFEIITRLQGYKAEISRRHKYYYPESCDRNKARNADGHAKAQFELVNRLNRHSDMLDDFLGFRDGHISTDQAAIESEVDEIFKQLFDADAQTESRSRSRVTVSV